MKFQGTKQDICNQVEKRRQKVPNVQRLQESNTAATNSKSNTNEVRIRYQNNLFLLKFSCVFPSVYVFLWFFFYS